MKLLLLLPLLLLLLLLLLLPPCDCIRSGSSHHFKNYGESVQLKFYGRTKTLKFIPDKGDTRVIWDDRLPNLPNQRGRMIQSYSDGMVYEINALTQQDSGSYIWLNEYGSRLNRDYLKVKELTMFSDVDVNDRYDYSFNLDSDNCNIFFTPKDSNHPILLVYEGHQSDSYESQACEAFRLADPCDVSIEDFTMSCEGLYEVKDQNDNLAYSVELTGIPPLINITVLVVSILVSLIALMCCCCCIKCNSKSSEKEIADIVATNEPAAPYNRYEHEPAVLGAGATNQPPKTTHSMYYASTNPLIHNNPTLNVAHSYSQVTAPSQPPHDPTVSYSANPSNAPPSDPTVSFSFTPSLPPPPDPTVPDSLGPAAPLSSDPVPQFELKGFDYSSASPLCSDSDHASVYTSDKLNFL